MAATFGKRKTPPSSDGVAPVFFALEPEPARPPPDRVEFEPLPDGRAPEIAIHGTDGHYVLVLDGPVTFANVEELHLRILECVKRGESNITLVIHSPGGYVIPTLKLYERVKYLPIDIKTHGRGAVQSAANVLMLMGTRRTAAPGSTFMFHPAARDISGRLNREDFEKALQGMKQVETALSRVYFERTTLTHAIVARFHNETVVYDATSALRFEIIHEIEEFEIPTEVRVAASPATSSGAASG